MRANPGSSREPELRRQLVEVCHRMYRQGYIAAGDGNVSARFEEDRVLVTPSGFHKGYIGEDDLIVVDVHGRKIRGAHKPSSEFLMHEVAYLERPDVRAVVHAHPPITVGLALAGVTLAQCVLSETCLVLGPILTAPYTTPTTEEVPNTLRPFLRQANAIVMDRHGALTVGRDLDEAYNRMEAMEHASKITHAARVIGPISPLPPPEVEKLQALARAFGIPRALDPCTLCNACPNGKGAPLAAAPTAGATAGDDAIVDAVVRKLRGA
jgi:L-fuculose-phosphate aldolase